MTERQISDGLAAYLRKENLLFIRARTDKKSTIAEGWPDFTICHCGHCLLIELKKPTGKLSEVQQRCILSLRSNGNTVEVCFSLEEAVSTVLTWLGVENAVQASGGPQKQAWCDRCRVKVDEPGLCDECLDEDNLEMRAPAQNLWIARFAGKERVFRGDSTPGGTCEMLRIPTPEDIRNLPRK